MRVSDKTPVMDEFDIIDNLTNGNVSKMTLENGIDALNVLDKINENSSDFGEMKNIIWSRNIIIFSTIFSRK